MNECGKCGGTGEICFSSTSYGPCPECSGKQCYIAPAVFRRWVIAKAGEPGLAWSGFTWVQHRQGIPIGGVQVSNFESKADAAAAALEAGLAVRMEGYCIEPMGSSITCYRCGMTSYNENDVKFMYCGMCHRPHEN
jgi:hypothetical protein